MTRGERAVSVDTAEFYRYAYRRPWLGQVRFGKARCGWAYAGEGGVHRGVSLMPAEPVLFRRVEDAGKTGPMSPLLMLAVCSVMEVALAFAAAFYRLWMWPGPRQLDKLEG